MQVWPHAFPPVCRLQSNRKFTFGHQIYKKRKFTARYPRGMSAAIRLGFLSSWNFAKAQNIGCIPWTRAYKGIEFRPLKSDPVLPSMTERSYILEGWRFRHHQGNYYEGMASMGINKSWKWRIKAKPVARILVRLYGLRNRRRHSHCADTGEIKMELGRRLHCQGLNLILLI